jgi:hypothetical protein
VLLKEIQNPDSYFYLFKKDGELAGYLKLNINDAQTEAKGPTMLEIERIYVRKKFNIKSRPQGRIFIVLNQNSVTMINFMLDDLSDPIREFLSSFLEFCIVKLDFNFVIASGWTFAG